MKRKKFVSLHSQRVRINVSVNMGLTGFDGKMKWYVSTRSWAMGGSLISSVGKLIGNNEYALAA